MRIKFLSVIVSFLVVSLAVSSCLNNDNDNYEFSSDATIHAFGIDTIHGKHYQFTIDQLNRLIYNRDSLPVGSDTIIDRILIDTMSVNGWVTSGMPNDTLFQMTDSVNLLPAMNNDAGMTFKVHANDGVTTSVYTLKVNVHLQDPDSLMWTDMQEQGEAFTSVANPAEQKAVILNGELLVYTSSTTGYRTSTTPGNYGWSEMPLNGLPADVRLSSIIEYKEQLYAVTESRQVYRSADGARWEAVESLGGNVIALINGFSDRIGGIIEAEGKRYFTVSTDARQWQTTDADALEEVPADFPTEQLSTARTFTGNGVEKVILVGMPRFNTEKTIPWFSLDGKGWASLENTAYDVACPGMDTPFLMYYGGQFCCFGGELDAIYQSVTGIAWTRTEKKFLLPESFKGKGPYTIIVEPTKDKSVAAADKRDFIWIVFGGNGTPNEVWRGRLNRLGFEIQD